MSSDVSDDVTALSTGERAGSDDMCSDIVRSIKLS